MPATLKIIRFVSNGVPHLLDYVASDNKMVTWALDFRFSIDGDLPHVEKTDRKGHSRK